jgi:GT2 family glycosyltransferase
MPENDAQTVIGRSQPTVSVLIATRNRPDGVRRAIDSVLGQSHPPLEVVVLDDASDEPVIDHLRDLEDDPKLKWLVTQKPSGVAGARNILVGHAAGDILVFLDDDAWLDTPDALQRVFELFSSNEQLGIVAFKIQGVDEADHLLQVPFRRSTVQQRPSVVDDPGLVSYYVGAAHAIHRDVFEKCGNYPSNFFYGHEELDLSFRAIDLNFEIRYEPLVTARHEELSSVITGVLPGRNELYFNVRNRIWVAYSNLPMRFGLVYTLMWMLFYLWVSLKAFIPHIWLRAVVAGVFGLKNQKRKTVNENTIKYLKRNHGRLWR